jgi:hypothetical protein
MSLVPRRRSISPPGGANRILLTSFDDFKVKDARYMTLLLIINFFQLVIIVLIFMHLVYKWNLGGWESGLSYQY